VEAKRRSTRRELVVVGAAGAAGAAAAAIATAGSGSGGARAPHAPPSVSTAAEVDIVVLDGLLRFERHCVAVYSLAEVGLIGGTRETAHTLLEHERQHALAVEGAIRDLGGTPQAAGELSEWRSAQAVARGRTSTLTLLHELEEQSVGAYIAAPEQITVEDVRATVGAVLATEAEHLALVLGELGAEQLEAPFVAGTGGWEQA
jgi:hypothetical protein